MEYTRSFTRTASSLFYFTEDALDPSSLCDYLNLDKGNTFNRFLVINIQDGIVDIPIIAISHISNILKRINLDNNNKIVVPLYENSGIVYANSFDSCINHFFNKTKWMHRIRKVHNKKGDSYYGGKGIIFNRDYVPLLLCSTRVSYKKGANIEPFNILNYVRPVIYVNPIVFDDQNDMINKGIIKKIIPYYTGSEYSMPYIPFINNNNDTNYHPLVIVDKMNEFFEKPIEPTYSDNIQDELNQTLVDNIEFILKQVQRTY